MNTLLRLQRIKLGLRMHEVAAHLSVDASLISRFESGKRLPTEQQVFLLSEILQIPKKELLKIWNAERIWNQIKDYPDFEETISMVMEKQSTYGKDKKKKVSDNLQQLLDEIDELKSKLDALRKYDSYRIAEALELEYTFESNRIEGNTLTLQETNLVVHEGLTVSGKSMREHLEAINHSEAIEFMKSLVGTKNSILERDLLTIHNLILRGIEPEWAGKYRQMQVHIKGSKHVPPAPYMVHKKMEDFLRWSDTHAPDLHPVVRAAESHLRLVGIHPFLDGNGRTSRLLMNLILLQHGYVIANISGEYENRMAYYEALEKAHVTGNKEPFNLFIAKTEKDCLKRYLKILGD